MRFWGITPYIRYEDAGAMLSWLAKHFGFEELNRYLDAEGIVRESEMAIGDQEIWLSGGGPGYWADKGTKPDALFLIWVDDVDEHHRALVASGLEAEAPADKPYGVRMYEVTDPEGYKWGFMQRLNRDVILQPGWQHIARGQPPRYASTDL